MPSVPQPFAVAAITTGLTNVEGGELEVKVCWKILVKVHLYVQEGKQQEEWSFYFSPPFHLSQCPLLNYPGPICACWGQGSNITVPVRDICNDIILVLRESTECLSCARYDLAGP